MKWRVICLAAALSVVSTGAQAPPAVTDISPKVWPKGEYDRFIAAQNVDRTKAGVATGGSVRCVWSFVHQTEHDESTTLPNRLSIHELRNMGDVVAGMRSRSRR